MHNEQEINAELLQLFLEISRKEFQEKTWGVTEQYLDVMEVLTKNGIPTVARIEKKSKNTYVVYFFIKDEKFYYTHYFDINDGATLVGIDVTPASVVCLRVYSDKLALSELIKLTTLIPFRSHNKGEPRGQGTTANAIWKDSNFDFRIDENEAGNFEKKLLNLLVRLENHKDELEALRDNRCEFFISVRWESYFSNTFLGGFYLTTDIIHRLHNLGLTIDFDLNASGVPFKD